MQTLQVPPLYNAASLQHKCFKPHKTSHKHKYNVHTAVGCAGIVFCIQLWCMVLVLGA